MQNTTNEYKQVIDAPVRRLDAKVELFNSSTLVDTFTKNDAIKSIDIERVGEDSKFFGFGVSHKFNIKLIDKDRLLDISTANHFKINLGAVLSSEAIEYMSFTSAHVTEVNRDENTNELSITAYCKLNNAKSITQNELNLAAPYTIKDVVKAVGTKIGASGTITGKNLLNPVGESMTISGITFTNNGDGTFTVKGTATENRSFSLTNLNKYPIYMDKGEYYVQSLTVLSGTMGGTIVPAVKQADGTITYNYLASKNGSLISKRQAEADYTLYSYNHYFTEGETIDATYKIQLEKNEVATEYEPYIKNFDLEYPDGANFEGTETLEEVLKAIAEATQTIYFMNGEDALVFRRLDQNSEAVKTIDKEKYFTLDSKTNRRLATICHATELGDNVSASITEAGTTQYVRDNPFWDLREDIAELVDNAIASIGGLTINQFACEWRGDFSLEPCDKIALTTKDNDTVTSYILNDSLHYSGALEESTEWQYTESEETESNPSNLGEAVKQTYARVDKANKRIDLLASETSTNSSAISSLQIDTNGINAAVQNIEKTTNEALESLNNDIGTLTETVKAKVSAEDVTLEIKKEMANGVSKVETATGFKFDENGLTVSKTGSEMSTTIDEDGMTIKRDNEERLVADNEGVKAYNLHAKTYLIVGETSRFEDYEKDGEARTGCFWIGGN